MGMIFRMRTGRPPIPEDERRTDSMKLPMSESEKKLVRQAAEAVGSKPVTWARDTLLKAAKRIERKRAEPDS